MSGHFCGIIVNNTSQEQSDIKTRPCSENMDTLCDREDDACEESWSDEEGEDPSYTYNYSLRRRRYFFYEKIYKHLIHNYINVMNYDFKALQGDLLVLDVD